MNFKNLKKNDASLNGMKQIKTIRKVSNVEPYQNDDDDGEDNDEDEDSPTEEDTNGGCEDCNSDNDLEAEDYTEYDQMQSLPPDNKKHYNVKMNKLTPSHHSSSDKRNKLIQPINSINAAPVNMLKGGERYYTNRAMDTRWNYINNNNRFKGGYPEGQSKKFKFYGERSRVKNGKRRTNKFADTAGNALI